MSDTKSRLDPQTDPSPIESIYDHPKYYDLLFGSDWRAEFDFLKGCFDRYASRPVERLFEPACGTGRLLDRFAQAGFEVGGNDLNEKAIDYCNDRLERHGKGRPCQVGDMAAFEPTSLPWRGPADAGFNTINSFRHLRGAAQARRHLECMAAAIAPGGLYVVGIHLLPTQGQRMEEESWVSRRGNLQVNSHMWTKGLEGRDEVLGMVLDVYTPTSHKRIEDEMRYYTYTRSQFSALLKKVPAWEVVATHDFAYELEFEVKIDASTEDVVFVLRRRR